MFHAPMGRFQLELIYCFTFILLLKIIFKLITIRHKGKVLEGKNGTRISHYYWKVIKKYRDNYHYEKVTTEL